MFLYFQFDISDFVASPVINWKMAWREGLVMQSFIAETMIGLGMY